MINRAACRTGPLTKRAILAIGSTAGLDTTSRPHLPSPAGKIAF